MHVDLALSRARLARSRRPTPCQLPTMTRRQRVSGRDVLLIGGDDARELSGFCGSNGFRQAASTFSMSHWLALTLAAYFLASPPRILVTGLIVRAPVSSYVDFAVGVDARHDEETAVRLRCIPSRPGRRASPCFRTRASPIKGRVETMPSVAKKTIACGSRSAASMRRRRQ